MIDTTLIDRLKVLAQKEKKLKEYKRRLRVKGSRFQSYTSSLLTAQKGLMRHLCSPKPLCELLKLEPMLVTFFNFILALPGAVVAKKPVNQMLYFCWLLKNRQS